MSLRPVDSPPTVAPRSVALGAPGPVRPVDATRPIPDAELARAGIDLATLLDAAADTLVARARPGTVALAELLERARAALVRGAAGEALAALDDGWEGAARTEGGWYYRAAALALLGLPGESERVLEEALERRPGSAALLFLQSVVRSGQGDSPGARAALEQALARRPAEGLLHAWRAVLAARRGDLGGAQAMLMVLQRGEGGTLAMPPSAQPWLQWVRQAITSVRADATRAAVAGHVDEPLRPDAELVADAPSAHALPGDDPTDRVLAPVERALRRLGAQFAAADGASVRKDMRALLQTLTVGGVLDRAARPEQVLSVRHVLLSALRVLDAGEPPHLGELSQTADGQWRLTPAFGAPVPGASAARSSFFDALRAGRPAEAAHWLDRLSMTENELSCAVLRTLLRGAREAQPASAPELRDAPDALRTANRQDDPLLPPIRHGLSLLEEPSARLAAREALGMPARTPAADSLAAALSTNAAARPTAERPVSDRLVPRADASSPASDRMDAGMRRAAALACVALAFAAMLLGESVAALAFAGGACWLALRSTAPAPDGRAPVAAPCEPGDEVAPGVLPDPRDDSSR